MDIFLVAYIIYGVIFGVFCAWVAGTKNRSRGAWFTLGLFFGIFALLALGLAGPVGSEVRQDTWASFKASRVPTVKKCPRCAEDVKYEAVVCRFCAHKFGEVPPPQPDLTGVRIKVSASFDGGVWEIVYSQIAEIPVGKLVGIRLALGWKPKMVFERVGWRKTPRKIVFFPGGSWHFPAGTRARRSQDGIDLVGQAGLLARLVPVAGATEFPLPA